MPNRPILIGAAVLLLAAAACVCAPTLAGEPGAPKTDANPPAPAAPADPPPSTGAFTPGPCPFEFGAYDIDCGTLTVPERHANPDGPTLELAVAILRSPNRAPDPIVYLAGGPGGSAIWEVDIWLATPYVQTRDVILIDQRGTGFSSPTLNCPEEEEGQSNAVDRCYRRLRSEGIDLAAFNSAESAADVEMLRQALGIAEWNVVGVSYGTRLALTLMRDHGAAGGIRSVVLDSPYPPEVDAYTEQGVNTLRAFDVLLDGCAADPACSAAYPDLRETFYRLLVELEDNPVDFTAYDPEYDETIDYTLTGYDLLSEVFLAMYNTGDIPYLPKMIADIDRGDYTLIGDLYLGYWLGDS
ncbi:MAG: alpha/beta hydrolase, partial [Chloroflexi bacterium]|nr:alpha/beta hydrolase [Chloroflexota bacterium]